MNEAIKMGFVGALRVAFLSVLAGVMLLTAHPGRAVETTMTIGQVWARASLPGAGISACYLTITNNGRAADRLLGASTPVAAQAEIHQSIMQNGVMTMRPLDFVVVPAGGTVALQPGAKHIMLTGLMQDLKPGTEFALTLNFQSAGAVETLVKVGAIDADPPPASEAPPSPSE